MTEKWNISAAQMVILLHATVTATAILVVPATTALHAERDLWISPSWASLVGVFTVYICFQLHRLYSGKTIIEHCCLILGRWPGKVIGLLFLFFFLHLNGIIIMEYSEFILGNILPRTPNIMIMGSMILACAFAVRGGIEVLGRLGQLFIPHRPLVLPLGFLLLLFGKWAAPNLQELIHFLSSSAPFYMTFIQTLLPLCLLFIAMMRKGKEKKKG